jgi:hypothetical protein
MDFPRDLDRIAGPHLLPAKDTAPTLDFPLYWQCGLESRVFGRYDLQCETTRWAARHAIYPNPSPQIKPSTVFGAISRSGQQRYRGILRTIRHHTHAVGKRRQFGLVDQHPWVGNQGCQPELLWEYLVICRYTSRVATPIAFELSMI